MSSHNKPPLLSLQHVIAASSLSHIPHWAVAVGAPKLPHMYSVRCPDPHVQHEIPVSMLGGYWELKKMSWSALGWMEKQKKSVIKYTGYNLPHRC